MRTMKQVLSLLVCLTLLMGLFVGCGGGGTTTSSAPAGTAGSAAGSSAGGAASSAAGETATSKADKPIVIANVSDIKTLDPQGINEVVSSRPTRHIFSKLVRLRSDLEIVPDLAESFEFVSDTELLFKLRQGVKWHDGSDFKASDVLFSFDRQRTMPAAAYLMEPIKEVIADDDYTIRIILHEPYAPIMANLAHVCSAIVPEKAVTELGDSFATNPVGTGSMKFVEMVPGDKIVLERFDDYFGEKALAPGLVFRCMPEESARAIALETGEIDMDPEVAYQSVQRIKDTSSLALYEWPTIFVEYVLFNNAKEPFNNPKVREAVAHCIDRDAVVQVVLEGHGRATDTVLPIGVLGHTEDYAKYERNIDRAKELLAEAGYPNGLSITISAAGNLREREATLVQANLAEIGITAEIDMMEPAALLETLNNGNHQMSVYSWGNGTGDPEGTLFVCFYSKMQGTAGNRSFYSNPEVDAALLEGRQNTDPDARAAAYTKATQLIMEDIPWVPLYNKSFVVGTQADLKGVDQHPTGYDVYDMLHYE